MENRLQLEEVRELYLDLLKKTLTHSLWTERTRSLDPSKMPRSVKRIAVTALASILKPFRMGLVREMISDPHVRDFGEDWPEYGHTMIGVKRLNNIQECLERIIREDVHGDLIETGVWRGGAVIFMRAVLRSYGIIDKTVWVADSFCGLPIPDIESYPADKGDICYQREFTSVSIEEVRKNFQLYNLLDKQVRFLQGWFKDTLPAAPIESLALLRLDGDMYQSTIEALENLYPKLTSGGFVIVDDYAAEPCKQAVHDYREKMRITDTIVPVDNWSVYWRRP